MHLDYSITGCETQGKHLCSPLQVLDIPGSQASTLTPRLIIRCFLSIDWEIAFLVAFDSKCFRL